MVERNNIYMMNKSVCVNFLKWFLFNSYSLCLLAEQVQWRAHAVEQTAVSRLWV